MLKKFMKIKKGSQSVQENKSKKEYGVLKMCRKCYAFQYENGWHFEKPAHLLERDPNEEVTVQFSQCSACVEEALAMYDMEYV
ncbi:hypothetical protein A2917_01390 [Candidatus Nomurabacteria bacterium RIFCSPLOWO2_01_FULL_42_17]|uniref:Uncharacterized protein n=1 Tax=Candidatus Nomurabacteria bacterium RIFCSPLOWO2_01_FULL_42_17 TaxID=1801780 RepID=A0A1F6XLG2_9BACT|nr:MAG: hypothetical protein A2917_01390 [Candidatus Nomurabacteria bacterium RIFCSPLOWO2_01_FULL_42_17]